LDISTPNAPKLLWKIDHNTSGFNELGQSWSQPKVMYSSLNIVNGVAKPMLVFGAGYDTGKDNPGVGVDDSKGRGIFMVDAYSGSLKWSVTPNETSSTNSQFSDFTDGITGSVAVLDSDSDGIADRFYAADTGGNIWRIDMPGDSPFSASTPWTVHKLAELGGTSLTNDRRFFSEPSIVRTFISDTTEISSIDQQGQATVKVLKQERPYEAILIGSGDRTSPTSSHSEDKFFMIKDPHINTASFVSSPTGQQVALPNVITASQLYNYTNNPFGNFVEPLSASQKSAKEQLEIDVSRKKGWFVDFTTAGEKSTAEAIAINGVAYFTSFTPADNSGLSSSCQLADGSGKLYAIDLALGTTVYDWRTWDISSGIPDTPSIIITQDTVSPCVSNCDDIQDDPMNNVATIKLLAGRIIPLDFSLKTARSYLYVTE
jgi:type IV pilus assembly protein PilY1